MLVTAYCVKSSFWKLVATYRVFYVLVIGVSLIAALPPSERVIGTTNFEILKEIIIIQKNTGIRVFGVAKFENAIRFSAQSRFGS